jgi:hypothetical protein
MGRQQAVPVILLGMDHNTGYQQPSHQVQQKLEVLGQMGEFIHRFIFSSKLPA